MKLTREETYIRWIQMWFIPFSLRIKFLIWGNSENETKQNSVSMQPICNEYSFMRRRIVKWAMKSVHTLEYVRKLSAKTNTNMIICADRCSRRFYLLEILWKWPIKSWAILCICMKKNIQLHETRSQREWFVSMQRENQ